MEQEITVGVHTGNVTFSFKTDREGSNLKEGFETISHLISSHKDLLQKAMRNLPVAAPIIPEEQVSLSQLSIPADEKEVIIGNIGSINRFDLFILLLHYAKRPLSYDQTMSLSKEVGKPIRYNWLDSEPHRKKRAGLIKSDPIPGKQEKLYSPTERGKKMAESIISRLKKEHVD